MNSAHYAGRSARKGNAVLPLATLLITGLAFAVPVINGTEARTAPQTSSSGSKRSKTTSSEKTVAATVAASRRSRSTTGEDGTPTTNLSATSRARNGKVVVSRKMVNGHWVRATRIGHSAPAGPSYQTHPDPERYQQIQQALSSNGYFKGEVNGQWGDDSTAALKQYQTDHKLPNDGKITSLSLIGLGLGPSRETPMANAASH